MSKYFVPVRIDGKWWVVEHRFSQSLNVWLANEASPKYPTLPSDSAYWASKAGVKMTSDEFEVNYLSWANKEHESGNYAIPLQSPTTKELIEQEAERLYSHAELVDNTFPNYESVNNIHRTRLKRAHVNGYKSALSLPKQDNGDAWDEVTKAFEAETPNYKNLRLDVYIQHLYVYIRSNYSISKIK